MWYATECIKTWSFQIGMTNYHSVTDDMSQERLFCYIAEWRTLLIAIERVCLWWLIASSNEPYCTRQNIADYRKATEKERNTKYEVHMNYRLCYVVCNDHFIYWHFHRLNTWLPRCQFTGCMTSHTTYYLLHTSRCFGVNPTLGHCHYNICTHPVANCVTWIYKIN